MEFLTWESRFRESQGDFFGSVNIEYFRRKIYTGIFSVFIRSFYNELFFLDLVEKFKILE